MQIKRKWDSNELQDTVFCCVAHEFCNKVTPKQSGVCTLPIIHEVICDCQIKEGESDAEEN